MDLSINEIRIDGGTQPRCSIDNELVQEYAESMHNGDDFPPIAVFFDGVDHWLADGFHRYHARKKLLKDTINADVKNGTVRDAVLYSVGANGSHGQRRTNDDKRKSVATLLSDDEWCQWSDREIARRCGVYHTTVGEYRRSLVESTSDTERTYTTKHGTTATMETGNIGGGGPKKETVPIYDASEEPESKPKRKIGPPSNGMQFARMAIMDLEQIQDDDIQRDEAFAIIYQWLNDNGGY